MGRRKKEKGFQLMTSNTGKVFEANIKPLKAETKHIGPAIMEKPKVATITVQSEPACAHCGEKGTSKIQRTDSTYLASMGFQIIRMKCFSEACKKATNGMGRPWPYRRKTI